MYIRQTVTAAALAAMYVQLGLLICKFMKLYVAIYSFLQQLIWLCGYHTDSSVDIMIKIPTEKLLAVTAIPPLSVTYKDKKSTTRHTYVVTYMHKYLTKASYMCKPICIRIQVNLLVTYIAT